MKVLEGRNSWSCHDVTNPYGLECAGCEALLMTMNEAKKRINDFRQEMKEAGEVAEWLVGFCVNCGGYVSLHDYNRYRPKDAQMYAVAEKVWSQKIRKRSRGKEKKLFDAWLNERKDKEKRQEAQDGLDQIRDWVHDAFSSWRHMCNNRIQFGEVIHTEDELQAKYMECKERQKSLKKEARLMWHVHVHFPSLYPHLYEKRAE